MLGDEELDELLSRAEMERLRGILEDREDAVLSLMSDAGEILWASAPGSASVFRRERREDYLGHLSSSFIHPDDVEAFERALALARAGGTARWEGRALDAEQRWRPVRSIMWRTHSGTELVAVTVPLRP
jgi:hypothetical protein